ncbi:MAG: peptidoglycan DD-metalloendopeptidase family protein [Oscillospiraceae bacterium]|nr:peptidoglycan DD-metalloendopeptidase family protein [Oscillospiraceae bacterium]
MKINLKILSFLLVFILLMTAMPLSGFAARTVEQIDADIAKREQQLKELENQKDKQEDYIAELREQIKDYDEQLTIINGQLDELNAKIDELDGEIAACESKIASLENEIADANSQIEEQNKKIDETYELLKKRMRAAYMAGEISELELFLNADNFQDFLTRSELVRQVSKHDSQIVSDLEEEIKTINELIKKLDADRAELEESKQILGKQRAEIDVSRQEQQSVKNSFDAKVAQVEAKIRKANDLIASYDANSAFLKKQNEKDEQEKAALARENDKFVSNNGSSGSGTISGSSGNHSYRVSSRGMICPLQDGNVIYSANFASHSSRGTASVDLTCVKNRVINGKTYSTSKTADIHAAASGTVIKTAYSASGYGNYLIVDHGNGVSTLYAHCDSLLVSVGAKVTQGQVIAKVGNTGNCIPRPTAANPVAGSHLHFEVRINGSRVNPENYLPWPLV